MLRVLYSIVSTLLFFSISLYVKHCYNHSFDVKGAYKICHFVIYKRLKLKNKKKLNKGRVTTKWFGFD